jgi:iron(III) transport system permease protein
MADLGQMFTSQIYQARQHVTRFQVTLQRSWILWVLGFVVVGFSLLPLIYLVIRTLGSGEQLWTTIFTTKTLAILLRSLWLAISVTFFSVVLAVPLAWLTVKADLPFRRVFSVLFSLPVVIPSYVGAYLFVASLGPRGIVAQIIESMFGLRSFPSLYGFPGAVYVLSMLSFPYIFMTVRAALLGLNNSQEEAARSLGFNNFQVFRRIVLPQLLPAISSGGLLIMLYVLRDFGAVSILRFDSFTRVIYLYYKSSFDRSTAAGLSLMLVVLALGILLMENKSKRRMLAYQIRESGMQRTRVTKLGKWRWPAFVGSSIVVLLSLLMPMFVLLYWFVRGILSGEQFPNLLITIWNSILSAGLAGLITTFAAIPVAVLVVRYPSRMSQFLEKLSYIGFSLPGIVIALAFVFFATNFLLPIYQSLNILIMAYIVLFIPQAVGSIRSSLLQVHPDLEDAARSLGRNYYQTLKQITIPLVRPGMVAGFALIFLTAMKELPATLILSPFDFSTLSTSIWSAVSEAFFARAAAPALLLIIVSSIPMAILLQRERS